MQSMKTDLPNFLAAYKNFEESTEGAIGDAFSAILAWGNGPSTEEKIEKWTELVSDAEQNLRDAFYEDTKEFNSRSNVNLLKLDDFFKIAKKARHFETL